jgi:hypothetical protein
VRLGPSRDDDAHAAFDRGRPLGKAVKIYPEVPDVG